MAICNYKWTCFTFKTRTPLQTTFPSALALCFRNILAANLVVDVVGRASHDADLTSLASRGVDGGVVVASFAEYGRVATACTVVGCGPVDSWCRWRRCCSCWKL